MNAGAIAGFAGFALLLAVLVFFVVRFARDLGRGLAPGGRRLDRAAPPALDDDADDGGDGKGEAEDRAPKAEDER